LTKPILIPAVFETAGPFAGCAVLVLGDRSYLLGRRLGHVGFVFFNFGAALHRRPYPLELLIFGNKALVVGKGTVFAGFAAKAMARFDENKIEQKSPTFECAKLRWGNFAL
jgi:hypothetical protein